MISFTNRVGVLVTILILTANVNSAQPRLEIDGTPDVYVRTFTSQSQSLAATVVGPPSGPDTTAAPMHSESYIVLFGIDNAEISSDAMRIFGNLKLDSDRVKFKRVVVVGSSDTSGCNGYNLQLSRRRAEAVKFALLVVDVKTDSIVTKGCDERALPESIKVGESDLAMRRVKLNIER